MEPTDIEFLTSAPGALLLSAAVTLLCTPLRAISKVPNWVIPYVSFLLGSTGYCLLEGWSARNFIIGLLIGGCSVGLHQSFKQGRVGWSQLFPRNYIPTISSNEQKQQ